MSKWLFIVLAAVLALQACNLNIGKSKTKGDKPAEAAQRAAADNPAAGEKEKRAPRDNRVPVEVAIVGRGPIEAHIDASANLDTESFVKVVSRTTNLVAELHVEEGDRVNKGDVLARLENESQRIELEKAAEKYKRDSAEYERQKHLVARKLVSDKQFADTTYTYQQSKLDRDNAKLNYDYTIIRAPIAGTVTQRLINLGDQVTNNKHLFDIVDFDTMVARIYLPEEHLKHLRVGQVANIRSQSFEARIFRGEVLRISPIVDAKTGTVKVTVKVRSQDMLRPGMYVDVSLVTDKKDNAILLPKKALVYDEEQTYYYRVNQSVVEKIFVEADIVDIDYIRPISGVFEGDTVVIAGHSGLKDQARVRFVNDPKSQPPSLALAKPFAEDSSVDPNTNMQPAKAAGGKQGGKGAKGGKQARGGAAGKGGASGKAGPQSQANNNQQDNNAQDDTAGKRRGGRQGGGPLMEGLEGLSREERRKAIQERLANMTEEEREKFIEMRRNRGGGGRGGERGEGGRRNAE